ncbi:MAG: PAS domain S-box protein [Desulfobacteraceae bacterium]|nr:PAS domain S-box protein [Desulfobacteraceae bacterium]
MMKLKTIGIFLLFFMVSHSVYGRISMDIKFNHLTVEEGLSHQEVLFVMQDSQGVMWFGTKHGLNKYDGMTVIPYFHDHDSNNSSSLTGNFAHWIHEDQNGALWIATWGDGISRYDPECDEFTNYHHDESNTRSLGSDNVWSLNVDRKGFVWAATDGGLCKLNPETGLFVRYRHDPGNPDSLSHNTVSRIVEDDRGILWISTYGGGLNRLDPETGTFTSHMHRQGDPESLGNNNLWSVFIDSRKRIWTGSEKGLGRFDLETGTFTNYRHDKTDPRSLSSDTVTFIHEDRDGMLWLGTFGGGLNRFDPERETFTHYRHDSKKSGSLSDNTVMGIFQDDTGTLWVATYGGVDKYDPGEHRFKHYRNDLKNPDDLSNSMVRSIYCDKNIKGRVWIGTGGGGLNRLDGSGGGFVHYLHDDDDPASIGDNDIWAISQDRRGDLWIGTHGAGLNRFNPAEETFVRYDHDKDDPNTLAYGPVYDLVVDEQRDVLWIASYLSGLDKYDIAGETFTHYRYDPDNPGGIVSYWSTAVFVDSKGFVWVGTEAGLSRFDPETEQFYNFKRNIHEPRSLSDNMIQAIFEDSRNIVWIGTSDGLNRYDEGTNSFDKYSDKDGLAGKRIAAITEDNQGHLWVSTDKGLSKFNFQKKTFRNYDRRDGLQGDRFLMHSVDGNEAGELFFGGTNGFNVFRPDEFTDNRHIPKVVFTDFQIFNQPVPVGEDSPLTRHINRTRQISMDYGQKVFSIAFVALNYRNSRKNRYAYMMEGFDRGFTYTDSDNRSATYTNLDPGKYTFHVKGSNNDGVWNDEGSSVTIIIIPPWWKTGWFKTLMGVSFFLIIMTVFSYIIRLRSEISQRKMAQSDLKVSEKKYRKLFDSSIDAILLLDPEKGYLDCNPAALELFGIESKEQLAELTPAELSPRYQPDGVLSSEKSGKMVTMVLGTGANMFEWTHKRLNGEEFIASVLATPVEIDGRTILQGTIRDITEFKRTQETMVQSEKILSLGGLAAGMAHEINNPLAGMMQTADVMTRRLTDAGIPANLRAAEEIGIDLDDIKAFMEKRSIPRMTAAIKESGLRISAVVNNMLSFARKSDALVSSHLLSELLDHSLELASTDFDLKKHYDFKTIKIIKEYGDGELPVPCDSGKVRQVMLNILRNGAQAMQDAGTGNPTFIIRTRTEEDQEMACVEIEDNGPGMDKATLKRVFEPFFTTKPVGVGTGLGLSVSYFIITENHGGEMTVESTPGSGAKFIIRLPLKGKKRGKKP